MRVTFYANAFGNLLDSALLARAGGHSVFNANDNTPTFSYELDPGGAVEEQIRFIQESLPSARETLWRKQGSFQCFPRLNFYLRLPEAYFHFSFDREGSRFVPLDAALEPPYLVSSMDLPLLAKILRRQEHWNNAEIGCHIDFSRSPDEYQFDAHVLLSFLHLSEARQASES